MNGGREGKREGARERERGRRERESVSGISSTFKASCADGGRDSLFTDFAT